MMNEHPRALDAFRESDGFLVLIHVLSTLPTVTPVALTYSWTMQDILQCMQLVFMVASKALDGHQQNQDFFQVRAMLCYTSFAYIYLVSGICWVFSSFGCV